jgi:hypothetical protein
LASTKRKQGEMKNLLRIMMKHLITLFLFTVIFSCSGPQGRDILSQNIIKTTSIKENLNDTLICYLDILSNTPFENDSLIIETIKELPGVQKDVKTYKNRHVDNAIDSVITYSFNSSRVQVYKTDNEQWVYNMSLTSPELKTKFGIGVNNKISNITGIDNCNNIDSGLRVLILSELEGLTSLVFTIEKGIVKKVEYSGYAD